MLYFDICIQIDKQPLLPSPMVYEMYAFSQKNKKQRNSLPKTQDKLYLSIRKDLTLGHLQFALNKITGHKFFMKPLLLSQEKIPLDYNRKLNSLFAYKKTPLSLIYEPNLKSIEIQKFDIWYTQNVHTLSSFKDEYVFIGHLNIVKDFLDLSPKFFRYSRREIKINERRILTIMVEDKKEIQELYSPDSTCQSPSSYNMEDDIRELDMIEVMSILSDQTPSSVSEYEHMDEESVMKSPINSLMDTPELGQSNPVTMWSIQIEHFPIQRIVRENECSICIDKFNEGYITYLSCGHVFHQSCLMQYFESNEQTPQCPNCRRTIMVYPS